MSVSDAGPDQAGPLLAPTLRAPARLEVFDIGGRRLGAIDLEAFRLGDGYAIPLDRLARFGSQRLVLVLRGAGAAKPFTLFLGGRP